MSDVAAQEILVTPEALLLVLLVILLALQVLEFQLIPGRVPYPGAASNTGDSMKNLLARLAAVGLLLLGMVAFANAAPLPNNRTLTIQLSSINSAGLILPVTSTTSQTDAQGKFTFSFPAVPASHTAPFLLLQVYDGSTLLRQTIVPAPETGGAVEAGISEVSDLQARALLSSISVKKKLTTIQYFLALTMLRTTVIPTEDENKIVIAINAATDAFYASLYAPAQIVAQKSSMLPTPTANLVFGIFSSHTIVPPTIPPPRILNPITGYPPTSPPAFVMVGSMPEQVAVFDKEFLAGLRRVMSVYRKSVDDSSVSDPRIEALGRYQAITLMMRELIAASAVAGIALDVTDWAYLASGGAAETSLELQGTTPAVTSLVRMCYSNGMILCQTFKTVHSNTVALTTLGISPPKLQRYSTLLNLISDSIPTSIRGIEVSLANAVLLDAQAYEMQIYNTFAVRDLAYMKAYMQVFDIIYQSGVLDTEYEVLLSEVIGSMSGSGGVMSGMTKLRFQTIMGTGENAPISWQLLPVWLYLSQKAQYSYSPVPGLTSVGTTSPVQPLFDQLSGAYLAQAKLQYDMALTQQLNYHDNSVAEDASAAKIPSRWISLSTAASLKRTYMTRRGDLRSRMSGITENEKDAFMTVTNGISGYAFF